ncbi:MAG: DNA-protecting protein DprA [Solirubrobacterales bacterium]|nr:DNA-protecting protein DprA [Solirubrobacterales bacterium]
MTDPREAAAVLALMGRRDGLTRSRRLAGAIEEEGSAVALMTRGRPGETASLLHAEAPEIAEQAERVRAWERRGIRLVTVLDEAYPVNLRIVHDRPPVLFHRGELMPENERAVAVVGARRAGSSGLARARAIARELCAAGYVVVSGLAAGIDTAAHTAALAAGGRTLAVIGTGLDHCFPPENRELQDRIAREHALVSQFPPDQGPRRWTFPQRNAVMSGLSRATVIVEASHTSGARIQARLALDHGRPVFLLESVLEQAWAREDRERPGVYVVGGCEEIVGHLERLYSDRLELER